MTYLLKAVLNLSAFAMFPLIPTKLYNYSSSMLEKKLVWWNNQLLTDV